MLSNPLVVALLVAALAVTILSITARFFQRRRESVQLRRRCEELRRQQGHLVMQQQELERLTGRILATSSTSLIAGFQVTRQIEAVFTDGHPSPNRAVESLKAMAAERGANAVINLSSERQAGGKCVARGDAVIVRPIDLTAGPA